MEKSNSNNIAGEEWIERIMETLPTKFHVDSSWNPQPFIEALKTSRQEAIAGERKRFIEDLFYLKEKCGNYTWINEMILKYDIILPLAPSLDTSECKSYVKGGVVHNCTCGKCF